MQGGSTPHVCKVERAIMYAKGELGGAGGGEHGGAGH